MFEYFVYSRWRLLGTGDVRDYLPSESLHRLQPGTASDIKRRALECHRSQTTCFYPGSSVLCSRPSCSTGCAPSRRRSSRTTRRTTAAAAWPGDGPGCRSRMSSSRC